MTEWVRWAERDGANKEEIGLGKVKEHEVREGICYRPQRSDKGPIIGLEPPGLHRELPTEGCNRFQRVR